MYISFSATIAFNLSKNYVCRQVQMALNVKLGVLLLHHTCYYWRTLASLFQFHVSLSEVTGPGDLFFFLNKLDLSYLVKSFFFWLLNKLVFCIIHLGFTFPLVELEVYLKMRMLRNMYFSFQECEWCEIYCMHLS